MDGVPTTAASRSSWRSSLLLGLGVAATSALSLWLTRLESGIALVWLANGLAVGVLLSLPQSLGRRLWSGVALGLLLPRLLLGDAPALAVWLSLVNLGEIAVVVALTRRYAGRGLRPDQLLRAAQVASLASLLACAASATAATLILQRIDATPGAWMDASLAWFAAHLLGLVITASLVSVALAQGARLLGRPGRRLDHALSLGLLVALLWLVLAQSRYPLLFVPLLPLAWISYRHGLAGAVLAVSAVAIGSALASAAGSGPFALIATVDTSGSDDDTRALLLRALLPQLYTLAACLLALPLAVLMAERRRLVSRLRASETRYRLLAEHTRDLVVRLAPDGARRYVSNSVTPLLGYAPEALQHARWELVHPDDAKPLQERLSQLFREGGQARVEFRVRHRDGHWVWLEALAERVPAEHGGGYDVVYSARDVSERVAAQRALRAQARTDVLTGLANRREFEERLGRALARNLRSGGRLALLAMDLDRFKGINDQLGHAAGDAALCEFARRIESSVRGHDLAARLGGDEFVVLMEDIADRSEAEAAGLRLLEVMREPMLLAGQHREVGTSIGLALCHGAHGATELMAAADAALYRAKAAGRGRIEVSTLD